MMQIVGLYYMEFTSFFILGLFLGVFIQFAGQSWQIKSAILGMVGMWSVFASVLLKGLSPYLISPSLLPAGWQEALILLLIFELILIMALKLLFVYVAKKGPFYGSALLEILISASVYTLWFSYLLTLGALQAHSLALVMVCSSLPSVLVVAEPSPEVPSEEEQEENLYLPNSSREALLMLGGLALSAIGFFLLFYYFWPGPHPNPAHAPQAEEVQAVIVEAANNATTFVPLTEATLSPEIKAQLEALINRLDVVVEGAESLGTSTPLNLKVITQYTGEIQEITSEYKAILSSLEAVHGPSSSFSHVELPVTLESFEEPTLSAMAEFIHENVTEFDLKTEAFFEAQSGLML